MKNTLIYLACIVPVVVLVLLIPKYWTPPSAAPSMPKTPNHQFKKTPLHVAAEKGDLEACQKLVGEGANINAYDELGWTPLIHAVQRNHLEIARALLDAGALMHYRYQREDTPEERAKVTKQQQELQKQLGSTEFIDDIVKKLPEDVREEMKDMIDSEDMLKESAQDMIDLHFEIQSEHVLDHCYDLPMLKLLVKDFNADVDHVAGDGTWPLTNFADNDDLEAVTWLLENGADPNNTSTGATAIFNAIRSGNLAMVKTLIQHGAKINAIDVDGWSVLFNCESVAMARHLIDQGADPTILDQAGFPCWHFVDDQATKDFLKSEALRRGLKKWTELD